MVMTREEPGTRTREGKTVTIVGAAVNCFLIIIKFIAGIAGNSQALIADAVHSVSDLFTDAVVLAGLVISRKAPDKNHHFGHGRYDTLASFVVGMGLTGIALYIGASSGLDIYYHREHHPTIITLVAASLSIVLKEILYRYTRRTGHRINSPAVIANAWHHRSDALSSVAVFIGVAGAQINEAWHILDAYAALAVSIFLLKAGIDILVKALKEITDTAPGIEMQQKIRDCALKVTPVKTIHDMKIRQSGGFYQMELHIVVDGDLSVREGHIIAKSVETCLHEEFKNIGQVIVHVDPT